MHESIELQAINELDTRTHDSYCNPQLAGGCAPGKQYYGRGPIQLSWNFNYRIAGKALGIDLWADPDLVSRDPAVAWKTAIWYWMEIPGSASIPSHEAMRKSAGFGETIRSINGDLECKQAAGSVGAKQAEKRIQNYRMITTMLGVEMGNNVGC